MPTYGLYLSTLVHEFSGIYVRKLSKIFISYSKKDNPIYINELQKALKLSGNNMVTWIDKDLKYSIENEWDKKIQKELNDCNVFICLLSTNSLNNDYVTKKEILVAKERIDRKENLHIQPIIIESFPFWEKLNEHHKNGLDDTSKVLSWIGTFNYLPTIKEEKGEGKVLPLVKWGDNLSEAFSQIAESIYISTQKDK